jgi:hypothetical protein
LESWSGVGARAALELLLLLGFASPAYVFFLLRGVAATASGRRVKSSRQCRRFISAVRFGLLSSAAVLFLFL